jgi:two-component sensor histidine kinase
MPGMALVAFPKGSKDAAGKPGPLPPVERALSGTTSFMIVFALLVATVPLLLFGAWLLYAESGRRQADIDALMRERALDLAGGLESELKQQVQVVQTLAALPLLDEPDLPLFYKAATRAQAIRSHWLAILLIDPASGEQVINTLRPLGTKLPNVQAVGGALEAARTHEAQIWIREPHPSSLLQRPVLSIAVPVIRDKELRFLLAASIENTALQEFMTARKLPANWVATIYAADGTIFARTPGQSDVVGQATTPEFAHLLKTVDSGVVKRRLRGGDPVYSAFQRLGFASLSVAVHAPVADVERAVPSYPMFIWAAGLAALLLTLALATLLLREAVRHRAEVQTQHLLEHTQHLLARQEMLLREVHHRVKNNLQTMASMVRIVARKGTPESQPAFQDIARRIATLGHAYDQIHKAEDMARLDLGIYLKSITQQIANSFGRDDIRVATMLDALMVDIDTALPVGLIAGELVTNAYKHAFDEERPGQLTVKLRDLGEYAMLTVRDSGPGIAGDPFSASAGLRIAEALASQVDGRLKAKNHPAGGAQFRLTFPLVRPKKAQAPERSIVARATGG